MQTTLYHFRPAFDRTVNLGSVMSHVTAARVIEYLQLANNGYTYAQSIPGEYRAKLAELVSAGVVVEHRKGSPVRRAVMSEVYILAEGYSSVLASMKNPS